MLLDLKVKKSSILLAVYLFSMFLPGYFSSPIMQMVSNIMMVGVAIYLFSVKYKPSRFMILTICYFAYLIVITFIYHNKAADIHLIISNLKIVFMLCVIEYLLKRTPNSTINIMFFILITFVIIDFASLGIYSIVLTTTVIMLFINLVTNPIYMTHCLKIEWFTFYPTLLRTIISCTCMTISFTLIAKTLNPNTWVSFVLTAILCGVIGCIIHLVFVFSRDEKSRILVIIKSKEK